MIRKSTYLTVVILFLATCLLFSYVPTIFASQQSPITVLLNGEKLSFDVEPYIKDGRTLVPFRGILEALGAEVIWNPDEKSVTTKSKTTEIYLKIGSNETLVNGTKVIIDVPAEITNSRTFVPLRFIAENLGATVLWDGTTRTVTIEYKSEILVVDPGIGDIPGSSGAVGVFDNDEIKIIIEKVQFDSKDQKFRIFGKADFNGKNVLLSVFDSKGNIMVADFVNFGKEQNLKSFEAVLNTRTSEYNPQSIIINTLDKDGNKMIRIASIDI